MKKLFTVLLFILTISSIINAQSWKPTYSVNCNLDLAIHGYDDWESNNPWAIAKQLFDDKSLTYADMKITESHFVDATTTDPAWAQVVTNAMEFDIYSNHIVIIQKICYPSSTNRRQLVDIYFKDSGDNLVDLGEIISCLPNPTDARYAKITSNKFIIRINCDGLMMIKKNGSYTGAVDKIYCKLNFYPGYKASSNKIPKYIGVGSSFNNDYNKNDVSHLFMDEYGGVGFYLLDDEREYYNAYSNATPEVTYNISNLISEGKIFWVAAFPPKEYDYENDYYKLPSGGYKAKRSAQAALTSRFLKDYTWTNGSYSSYRIQINNWVSNKTDPLSSYFFVSNANSDTRIALQTNISDGTFVNLTNGGLFIHHEPLSLWKDWLFGYIPRANLGSPYDPLDILRMIKSNLNYTTNSIQYLVYTSPQYFIKGTHYNGNSSKNISPYAGFYNTNSTGIFENQSSQGNDFRTCNNLVYETMSSLTNRANYSINGNYGYDFGDGVARKLPILNNYDQYWANNFINSTTDLSPSVDKFLKSFTPPKSLFFPLNREGENMNTYLEEVSKLDDCVNGIFMDTPYEFNIARTYQLMRQLRTRSATRNFILMFHESARAGQDAYLPQIDAYANYIVNGEGNKEEDFYDRKLWRYFISTTNISNTSAYILAPSDFVKFNNNHFFQWCSSHNIKLMHPSISKTVGNHSNVTAQVNMVETFWTNFPTTPEGLKSYVNQNLEFHQADIASSFSVLGNPWIPSSSIVMPNYDGNAKLLKGDFDNNKKEDLVIFTPSTSKWNFISNDLIMNNTITYGTTNSIPFIGDFNGDGKSDIGYINKTNPTKNILSFQYSKSYSITESSGTSFIVKQNLDFESPTIISLNDGNAFNPTEVLTGDFNGDKKEDILFCKVNSGKNTIAICVSSNKSINLTAPYELPCLGIPFVSDIDGDHMAEIIIVNSTLSGNAWNIYKPEIIRHPTGYYYITIVPMQTQMFGNSGDTPLVGNLDGTEKTDFCVFRNIATNIYHTYYALSSYPTFYNSPDCDIFDGYTGTVKPFIVDINGDGYDDTGIYINNQVIIKLNQPGTVNSSTHLQMLKSSSMNEIAPIEYNLSQNYPNPFNPSTTIKFDIPKVSRVSLKIYNVLGQEVETLVNEIMEPGAYNFKWDAGHFASGMYIYRIEAGDFVQSKKMMLIK